MSETSYPLVPDRAQFEVFADRLFRYADEGGYIQLRAFRDDIHESWQYDAWPSVQLDSDGRAPLVDAAVKFASDCANASVPVVFAPPVVTLAGPRDAAEGDVANGVVLSVECDEAPLQARERLEQLLGPATLVIESGGEWPDPETGAVQPRLHLHWRLTEPTRAPSDHARLKQARRLAKTFVGSDGSAVPLVHPMRWPGSWHRKNPSSPRLARIVSDNAEAEIDLDDAIDLLDDAVAKAKATGLLEASADVGAETDPCAGKPNDGLGAGTIPKACPPAAARGADNAQEHRPSHPIAEDLLDVCAALTTIPNKDVHWNDWNRIGMATWAATEGSDAGFAAFIAWSAKSSKFNYAETRARWDHYPSKPPTGIGAGTLFHEAKAAKAWWRKPSDSRKWWVVDTPVVHQMPGADDQPAIVTQPATAARPNGIKLLRYRDMHARIEDRSLVSKLLNQRENSLLVGAAGTAKTFLAIDLALGVARGASWFGRKTCQCGVVYIAAEAGVGIVNRVAAYKRMHADISDDLPFAAITSPVNLREANASTGEIIAAIEEAGLEIPVGLIIVDTLSRSMAGGDENNSADMGAFVSNIDRLRDETGAHILIVHHLGKDHARGARGHSLLNAAVDTEITVTRDESAGVSTATVTKQRDLPMDGKIGYRLRVVELGHDQHGNAVTSCVVEDAEPAATPAKQVTGKAKLGLDVLKNCMADHGVSIPASIHVPTGAVGVTLDQWQGYLEMAAVINRKGNPREEFKRIRVTLQERGIIGVWGDYVWLSHAVT